MAALRQHAAINMAPGADALEDSMANLGTTYHSHGMAINAHGVRLEGEAAEGAALAPARVELGDLDILEELGRGASAVVKRARHQESGADYVVKCFNILSKQKREMLMTEVELMMNLDDPSIVKMAGACLDEMQIDMILEFMDRGAIEDLVVHCRHAGVAIPEHVLAAMTFQILWGLAFLECENMMHRDIKAANLLLNQRGEVKITDFGIGTKFQPLEASMTATWQDDPEERMAKTAVGTRRFMSPERLEGKPYTGNADVWSLGAMHMEILMGQHPLAGLQNELEQLTYIQSLDPATLTTAFPDEVRAGISGEFFGFLSWVLAVNPVHRATAQQLLQDPWLHGHLGTDGQVSPEVCARAAAVLKEWLDTAVPSYKGPSHSEKPTAAAPAAAQPDEGCDFGMKTLDSDSGGEEEDQLGMKTLDSDSGGEEG